MNFRDERGDAIKNWVLAEMRMSVGSFPALYMKTEVTLAVSSSSELIGEASQRQQ